MCYITQAKVIMIVDLVGFWNTSRHLPVLIKPQSRRYGRESHLTAAAVGDSVG
jgi:hypothetical protein